LSKDFAPGFHMDGRQLVAEILERPLPAVDDGTLLQDLAGWDSLKLLQLVVRLETLLGRELTERELEETETIGRVESFFR
jgi:acyl carrier protein